MGEERTNSMESEMAERTSYSGGMEKTLLLVDDEDRVLSALHRLFRTEGYTVLEAGSGDAALEVMAREAVGVVIADQQMPNMNGAELLRRIRERYPETVRIMLTGYCERESFTEAINLGHIYKFALKPWDNVALRGLVKDAFQQYELMQENKRLLQELDQSNRDLQLLNLELERRVEEKTRQLMRSVHYDALTGLPNRLLCMDRLQQSLGPACADGTLVAVIFVDLDRFKRFNETLGPMMGDKLLCDVAARLNRCVSEGDTVARLGDDEFTLILTDIRDEQGVTSAVEAVQRVLGEPIWVNGVDVFVTGSIGISVYPNDGITAEVLWNHADIAMNHAKAQGRDNFQYYAEDMNARAMEWVTMENSLRHALERGEFLVFYQPQVELASGRVNGVEALLRWQHPTRGLVAPGEFIPLMEHSGLIEQVGEWVLIQACNQIRLWHSQGYFPLRVAVNLSPRQFLKKDLVEMVRRVLIETGIDPASGCLELEITESMLMQDAVCTMGVLGELSAMGVRLSIDDFGTGYSSLSYLKRFPIDVLKIDRSFIEGVGVAKDSEAIVSAIVAMAHSLGVGVIAEGVETEEQLSFLQGLHCEEFQGFVYSKPVPAGELEGLLGRKRPGRNARSPG